MSTSMRGAMYNGVRNVKLTTFPKPEIKPGAVIVKNVRAGICGTDVHAYVVEGTGVGILEGNQFGHEMAGVIDEVGEGLTGFEKGTRVFVNPSTFREATPEMDATMSCDMAGAFSEYIMIEKPEWDYNIFKLPDQVTFDQAALTEPLSVGMNAVLRADPKMDDHVIIMGAGTIGLAVLVALKYFGVKEVIVSDMIPLRLEKVKAFGGIPFDASKGNVNEFAIERWGSHTGYLGQVTNDADIVFDCAGYPGALHDYLEYAMLGSKLICVALGGASETFSSRDIVLRNASFISATGYTPEVNKKVLEMVASGKVSVDPFVTSKFGLSQIAEAFEAAADAKKNIKVEIVHAE